MDLHIGDIVVIKQPSEGSMFLDLGDDTLVSRAEEEGVVEESLEFEHEFFLTCVIRGFGSNGMIEVEYAEPVPFMSGLDIEGDDFLFGDTITWIKKDAIVSHYRP